MRTWILALTFLVFCFLLPLQCFIIGDSQGLGVQGAFYRYQMTIYGDSLIPITYEIEYILLGLYSGKTAISVILWALGTLVLAGTTAEALISLNSFSHRTIEFLIIGIVGSCILFFLSCVAWYGMFFSSPAGTCLPLGIVLLALYAIILQFFKTDFPD